MVFFAALAIASDVSVSHQGHSRGISGCQDVAERDAMDVYGLRAEFAHATGVCKWREPASFGGQLYSYYLCEFLKAEAARKLCFN